MTVSISDKLHSTSTLESPFEIITCALLSSHLLFTIALLSKITRGKGLDTNSSSGKFAISTLLLFIIWQGVNMIALYYDCPKIISIISALLASQLILINACSLADILQCFSYGSKIITQRFTLLLQIVFFVMHLVLVGPHYYLIRYYDTKTPISLGVRYN
jgi:hypothetical protein